MKYIRTDFLGIIIFSETQSHKDIAERVLSPNDEVVSAGFVNQDDYINDGQVTVHGRSTTLNIDSQEDDEVLLRIMLKR